MPQMPHTTQYLATPLHVHGEVSQYHSETIGDAYLTLPWLYHRVLGKLDKN